MRDTRLGRSDDGSELCFYYLDNIKEVFQLAKNIYKVSETDLFTSEKFFIRLFKRPEVGLLLLTGMSDEKDYISEGIEKYNLSDLDLLVENLKQKGYSVRELNNGMPLIDCNGISEEDLEELMLSFLNVNRDIQLIMGNYTRVSWKPSVLKGYIGLELCISPSGERYKTINGEQLRLY